MLSIVHLLPKTGLAHFECIGKLSMVSRKLSRIATDTGIWQNTAKNMHAANEKLTQTQANMILCLTASKLVGLPYVEHTRKHGLYRITMYLYDAVDLWDLVGSEKTLQAMRSKRLQRVSFGQTVTRP